MNTAKQINVIIGLLMIGLLGTLLYYMFDNGDSILGFSIGDRQAVAEDRQEMDNVTRGAALFARYCRACHGLTGQGSLERTGLPGAVLNDPNNRPPDLATAAVAARQARLTDTIHCGRVGTRMPPWSTDEGGSLNDFQIFQLVTLITSQFSAQGWAAVIADGNTTDAYNPAKFLTADIGTGDTVLHLNDASGFTKGDFIRIGADTIDEPYEIMQVTDSDTTANTITVTRGPDIPWDPTTPSAGTTGSDPIAHASGSELYIAPQAPGTAITGAAGTTSPCGQLNAPSTPSASVAPVAVTDGTAVTIGDNYFQFGSSQDPPLTAAANTPITVTFQNTGTSVHNFHIDGPDGKFDTADDDAATPDPIAGGTAATVTVNLPPGTYNYRCDFHPDQMKGTIVVS